MLNVGLPVWQVLQNFMESLEGHRQFGHSDSELPKSAACRRNAEWVNIDPPWHFGRELDAHYWYRHPDGGLLNWTRRHGDKRGRCLQRSAREQLLGPVQHAQCR